MQAITVLTGTMGHGAGNGARPVLLLVTLYCRAKQALGRWVQTYSFGTIDSVLSEVRQLLYANVGLCTSFVDLCERGLRSGHAHLPWRMPPACRFVRRLAALHQGVRKSLPAHICLGHNIHLRGAPWAWGPSPWCTMIGKELLSSGSEELGQRLANKDGAGG